MNKGESVTSKQRLTEYASGKGEVRRIKNPPFVKGNSGYQVRRHWIFDPSVNLKMSLRPPVKEEAGLPEYLDPEETPQAPQTLEDLPLSSKWSQH